MLLNENCSFQKRASSSLIFGLFEQHILKQIPVREEFSIAGIRTQTSKSRGSSRNIVDHGSHYMFSHHLDLLLDIT